MSYPTMKSTSRVKDQHPPPQLSCKLCRKKKLKCDKQAPCGNCRSSGTECNTVFRHRLPRGRHAKPSSDKVGSQSSALLPNSGHDPVSENNAHIQKRSTRARRPESMVAEQPSDMLSGLEHMVAIENLESDDTGSSTGSSVLEPIGSEHHVVSGDHLNPFWSDSSELCLVPDLGADLNALPQQAIQPEFDSMDSSCGSSNLNLWDGDFTNLGPQTSGRSPLVREVAKKSRLCNVYLRQVDPVIKILHRPAIEKWLGRGLPYMHYPQGHVSTEALAWAICYSAVCSMTEEQCQSLIQQDKSTAVATYQQACQNALDRAGYLTTEDIVVIQAFVLYLIARRVHDRSLATWTLTAVLVRIATAQDLHVEARAKESPFDQQMRARLWLTICSIDLQASLAQNTRPMIPVYDVQPALSRIRNLNDEDLSNIAADGDAIQNREEITDMTLAFLWYHLQVTGRLLHESASKPPCRTQQDSVAPYVMDHEWREQQAYEFQRKILGLIGFCDTESSPYAWFTWHSAQCLVSSARISAMRPNTSAFSSSYTVLPRPRVHGDLLQRTIAVLKKMLQMQSDPRAEGFRWYVAIPWAEIAIATSECLSCHDPRTVFRAWPTIEAAFKIHESQAIPSKMFRLLSHRMQLMQQMWAKAAAVPSLIQPTIQPEISVLSLTPSAVPTDEFSGSNWTEATTPGSSVWSSLCTLPDDGILQRRSLLGEDIPFWPGTPTMTSGGESIADDKLLQTFPNMNLWCEPSNDASSLEAIDLVADNLCSNRENMSFL